MKECDYYKQTITDDDLNFNPRTLWKSATGIDVGTDPSVTISIHALYERVRHVMAISNKKAKHFNPRTLWKSATKEWFLWQKAIKFQSTHSMKECDDLLLILRTVVLQFQSTHSMKECDSCGLKKRANLIRISIHALYERVRPDNNYLCWVDVPFQSTHSMKECDYWCDKDKCGCKYFNPRTLWKSATQWLVFCGSHSNNFNPRTLWKSATSPNALEHLIFNISIHALYERVRLQKNGIFSFILH